MNEYLYKIRRILTECQKHSYRMDLAHHEMARLIPLDVSTVDALSDADIKTIDQFLLVRSLTVGLREGNPTLNRSDKDVIHSCFFKGH